MGGAPDQIVAPASEGLDDDAIGRAAGCTSMHDLLAAMSLEVLAVAFAQPQLLALKLVIIPVRLNQLGLTLTSTPSSVQLSPG